MKLDLAKVQRLKESYSVQEMFAALVWGSKYNEFDGEKILTTLNEQPDLWLSFIFTRPIYAPDKRGLGFGGAVMDTLLAMANNVATPEDGIVHWLDYPADAIYILTRNQDDIVSKLVEFGKEWEADSVTTWTHNTIPIENEDKDTAWFRRCVLGRLQGALWGNRLEEDQDAAIVGYWWDWKAYKERGDRHEHCNQAWLSISSGRHQCTLRPDDVSAAETADRLRAAGNGDADDTSISAIFACLS